MTFSSGLLHVVELKILRGKNIPGSAQLATYMKHKRRREGWLVFFDARDPKERKTVPPIFKGAWGTIRTILIDITHSALQAGQGFEILTVNGWERNFCRQALEGESMPECNRTERLLSELSDKLDLLIKVVSIQVGADKSTTERARLLKMAGLDNPTIAAVLNTSYGSISVLTANLRTPRR